LITAGRVDATRPARMAIMETFTALIQLNASVIIHRWTSRMDVTRRALATVRTRRIDADGVGTASVTIGTSVRLAFVNVYIKLNNYELVNEFIK